MAPPKPFTERILTDVCADPTLTVALLRYFNPIGAHKSGLIGEDPNGIPNNLMPYIAKVAVGKLEKVHIFGNDYPTPDGTGVRDYIHVVDLARPCLRHPQAGDRLRPVHLQPGHRQGFSVLEVLHAFEKACGHELPYVIEDRRPATLPHATPTPPPRTSWAGWPSTALRRCAPTAGAGRARTGRLPHRTVISPDKQAAPSRSQEQDGAASFSCGQLDGQDAEHRFG